MSGTRHKPEPHARAVSWTWSAAYTWPSRRNDWGQLLFASRGVLTVGTDAGLWIVPPHQAVWVPAGVTHSVKVGGRVAIRAVYLSTKLKRRLPRTCRVIELSPLLWELLRRAMKLKTLDRRRAEERHLLDVLVDQLRALPVAPFDLPMPRDARGVRAATLVRDSPAKRHRLAEVAKTSAASSRTLERLFRTETGWSFGAWRQRARLLRALELLAEGTTVTKTAIAVGYDSTSAFVAAFRRALGNTPGRYFKWSVASGQ
ncbi:MAG TPA: helix-turn-helix transcriptional regulator [Thermoanaerobaculia bacterium]|nr:helix-turn-helix transcriptional regulator [Thermoanaerobaculia bacterium]